MFHLNRLKISIYFIDHNQKASRSAGVQPCECKRARFDSRLDDTTRGTGRNEMCCEILREAKKIYIFYLFTLERSNYIKILSVSVLRQLKGSSAEKNRRDHNI